ncbi:MAG: FAD-dependent oxidoreductase [Salibacteraceae bacterium]
MEKIIVVGAGLVGSLLAIKMARRGYQVEVFERRGDLRTAEIIAGRSINLALSNRGWKAIEEAGVTDIIEKIAIPMKGRIMHSVSGELTFQQYGKEDEAIYSVSRGELNRQLLLAAGRFENVTMHFHARCLDLDLNTNTLHFENSETGETMEVSGDRIFGTDGAFSAIRNRLMRTDRFNYSQHYLPHGYKELTIPPGPNGTFQIDKNALHIWPRGQYMLIALPNLDGSFTCTLFFPYEGAPSFASLTDDRAVRSFFEEVFPDTLTYMPKLEAEYFSNPTASLITVKTEPWNYEDRILIIGDASHAIVPFYGQGMNSGFEDCTVLTDILDRNNGDWSTTIPEFAAHRKPDADAISDLALRNFIEMRDLVGDEGFLLQKKIEKRIYDRHPEKWVPLYSMVTFSHRRYSEALALGKKQDKIMASVMAMENIKERWDSDEVEQRILEQL